MLMMGVQVDGLRKHPYGRVDQLEDRYLGMVEAPSSNLGTSTIDDFIMAHQSQWWPCCHKLATLHFGQVCWLGTSTSLYSINVSKVDCAHQQIRFRTPLLIARHVHHSID